MSRLEQNEIEILDNRIGGSFPVEPPQVSIVVPAYRSAKYIADTLRSAIGQGGVTFELIVVNDGSPDTNELEIELTPFFGQIKYIRIENSGAGAARNVAIEHSRGTWIAFLDADDIWLDGYLAAQIEHAATDSLDMVYCDAVIFSEHGDRPLSFMQESPSRGDVSPRSLIAGECHVITSGTVVRRDKLIEVGMFEWDRVLAEDFHLWMRMAANGAKIGYREDRLLRYRVHAESLSGDAVDRVRRSIGAYDRVRETIDLDAADVQLLDEKLRSFEADLAVELGKASLLQGDDKTAASHFARAVELRGSLKLRVAAFLAAVAPGFLRWSQLRRTAQ